MKTFKNSKTYVVVLMFRFCLQETNSFIMDSDLALSRYIFLRSLQPSFSSEQKKKLTRMWMSAGKRISCIKKIID